MVLYFQTYKCRQLMTVINAVKLIRNQYSSTKVARYLLMYILSNETLYVTFLLPKPIHVYLGQAV